MKKILLTALLVAPFFSMASGTTFSIDVSSDSYASYSTSGTAPSSYVQERNFYDSASKTMVNVSGWAWKGESTTNGKVSGTVKKADKLGLYSGGLGITNGENDAHVADGGNGYGVDFFLLTFGDNKKVALDKVSSGYVNADSLEALDIRAEAVSFDNSAGQFLSRGEVVSLSYNNTANKSAYYSANNTTLMSNQWVVYIGASVWQGFKMQGFGGNIGPAVDVSEPGALALFALGLAFMARRKQVS